MVVIKQKVLVQTSELNVYWIFQGRTDCFVKIKINEINEVLFIQEDKNEILNVLNGCNRVILKKKIEFLK